MILLLSDKDMQLYEEEESREKSKVSNYFNRSEQILDRPLYGFHGHEDSTDINFILNDRLRESKSDLTPVYNRNIILKGIKCMQDKQFYE